MRLSKIHLPLPSPCRTYGISEFKILSDCRLYFCRSLMSGLPLLSQITSEWAFLGWCSSLSSVYLISRSFKSVFAGRSSHDDDWTLKWLKIQLKDLNEHTTNYYMRHCFQWQTWLIQENILTAGISSPRSGRVLHNSKQHSKERTNRTCYRARQKNTAGQSHLLNEVIFTSLEFWIINYYLN